MYRLFITTAWSGSNTPFEHTLPNGETALVYQTLPQAYNAASGGDILQPAPPGTPGFCFYDASGEPLQTVAVNLGANWTTTKSITLQGGWCRLRLDGGGTKFFTTIGANASYIDVDFCKIYRYATSSTDWNNYGAVRVEKNATFVRCAFLGCATGGGATTPLMVTSNTNATFRHCAFVGETGSASIGTPYGSTSFIACVCKRYNVAAQYVDCIKWDDMTQAELDATFVKPPDLSATWTNELWRNIDLRLLPTSPYATGATSVQSGQTVYDLAGNRRKPGGALGAYEVLDDVTHWNNCAPVWSKIEYADDSAPRITDVTPYHIPTSASMKTTILAYYAAGSGKIKSTDGATWSAIGASSTSTALNSATPVLYLAYGTAEDGPTSGITTIRRYNAPTEGAVPVPTFASKYGWTNQASSAMANAAPDASSVCYVGDNRTFRASGAKVAKTYVAGWTRAKFDDADVGELVLGLNAEATIAGKATIKNFTGTSDAAFAGIVAESPAEITFKDCAISDSASE